MSQHRITLHLTHTNTSSLLTTLQRLLGENINWSSRTSLTLIMYHVSESLIIHQSHIDVYFELGSIGTTIHSLIAIVIKTSIEQLSSKVINGIIILVHFKSLIFDRGALESSRFSSHTLY